MSIKASLPAWLALVAPLVLVAAPAVAAGPDKPAKPLTAKEKAAAAKAAADKAVADKAAADAAATAKIAADAAADKAAADQAAADRAAADQVAADKAAADKAAAARAADDPYDPYEDPDKTYRFIGLRFRDAVAPKFIVNWFADGGRNVNAPMVGPEFITRRDHLEIAVALMYADYAMDPFLFKGKSDPSTSYELVASSLKLGYLMVDILYEIPLPFDEKKPGKDGRFALLIGGGVGVAGVFGSLYRSQAYPNTANADPGNPSQWNACTSASDGNTKLGAGYCANPTNNHYWGNWVPSNPTNVGASGPKTTYSEASWANGGSKPLIFPWLALPQISFRYKPIKQFQTKLDFGFSTSGFFFGLSASYGIPSSSTSSPPPPPPPPPPASSGGGEK